MTARSLHTFALIATLSWLPLSACGVQDACAEVGVVQACSCGGTTGARVCMAERTWGGCDCSGAIALPNPILGVDAGGGSGGAGGASGVGGSGGISGTGGTGGVSGTGGTGGVGGAGGGQGKPYGACTDATVATACLPDSICLSTTIAPETWTVCSPKCQVPADCPRGDGAYAAVAKCNMGQCGLDCTPPFLQPLLTCPTGMECIILQAGAAYCHDATPTTPP